MEGVPLGRYVIDCVIYTDTSKVAGKDRLQVSGLWSFREARIHIKVLDLETGS